MTDAIDKKIISILKTDGRMSFVDIAKKIGLTEGAVRARVLKLIKDGTIKRFTVDAKDDVKALVLVATSRAVSTATVANTIRKLGVDKVYEISGNFDIVCMVEAESVDELNSAVDRIRATTGVADTSTSLILK